MEPEPPGLNMPTDGLWSMVLHHRNSRKKGRTAPVVELEIEGQTLPVRGGWLTLEDWRAYRDHLTRLYNVVRRAPSPKPLVRRNTNLALRGGTLHTIRQVEERAGLPTWNP